MKRNDMKPIEKIWKVIQCIDDQRAMTASGEPCKIDPSVFDPLPSTELESVLNKLEKEENAIKVIAAPHSSRNNRYRNQHLIVEVLDAFDDVRNRIYGDKSHGIDTLSGVALLRVWDVMQDLSEKVQLTRKREVSFPLVPAVIRHALLMPGHSVNAVNEYCLGREQALDFLQDVGVLDAYSYTEEGTQYQDMNAIVNRLDFDNVLAMVNDLYDEAFVEQADAKEDEAENEAGPLCVKYANGYLNIGEHTVEIGDDSYEDQLCEVLFADAESVQKEWGNDQILAKWGWDKSRYIDGDDKMMKEELKKVYRTAKRVNKKVEDQTKHEISKIISERVKSVSVLPEYRRICDE